MRQRGRERPVSRRFDGDVVLHRCYPRARYVPETTTVEGHLYATEDQTVTLRALDHTLTLRRGDPICHGHSGKFHPLAVKSLPARRRVANT